MKRQEFKPVSCRAELPFRVRGMVCNTLPDDCKSLNAIVKDVLGYKHSHIELATQDDK